MIRKVILGSMMTLASISVFAGQQQWDFGDDDTYYSSGGQLNAGNTLNYSVGGINLEVSAWASTDEGCVGGYGNDPNSSDPDPCVKDAALKQNRSGSTYYGIGIINRDEYNNGYTGSPHHAIDSVRNGGDTTADLDYEMVLLTFDQAVNIENVHSGWLYNDADTSILAYTGNGSTDFFASHTRWDNIISSGWQSIQNSNRGDFDSHNNLNVSNDTVFSKYWLVGAYNSVFGGHKSTGDDAFKLAGLTTFTPETDGSTNVNTPATIGLFAGILGLMLVRRRT